MTVAKPFLRQTELYQAGQDGYHTYRIPSLVVATDGTILAFCEARRNSASDSGDIDLVVRRSHDNGENWTEMIVVAADGNNTTGNPCPVVDRDTGTIWLPLCKNNHQIYVTSSNDQGATWSELVEITQHVKLPSWLSSRGVVGGVGTGTGPGHGVQLRSGRLIIPCWHHIGDTEYSHVLHSDDHGDSWHLGPTIGDNVDECELVQRHDGSLYINMRGRRVPNRRAYALSHDDGDTWSVIGSDDTLVDPDCQGSVVSFTDVTRHDRNRVLLANAASLVRERLTVRISYDGCQTWSMSKVLHRGPSAYSDLCIAPDMSICCLYERGEVHPYEKLTLAQFNLEWLTNEEDRLVPAKCKGRPEEPCVSMTAMENV